MPAVGVNLYEARDCALFATFVGQIVATARGDRGTKVTRELGALCDAALDRPVEGLCPARSARQLREVLAPTCIDAGRVSQILFVESFDIIGVAAVQRRGFEQIAARCAHGRKGPRKTIEKTRVV